jgi:hypothetical protein
MSKGKVCVLRVIITTWDIEREGGQERGKEEVEMVGRQE